VTVAVAMVLRAFLDDIEEPRYGYDLMRQLGFPSGKLYPILARLQKAGWLLREHENIDPAAEGRPPRALYRLSPTGVQFARTEVAALSEYLKLPSAGRTGRLRSEGGRA
jgi:PadR family transcriptional regulator, regulatory protein PadR